MFFATETLTLTRKIDLDIFKMYLWTKNELSRSRLQTDRWM